MSTEEAVSADADDAVRDGLPPWSGADEAELVAFRIELELEGALVVGGCLTDLG
ncbi:hypothetical protein T261_08892 [Streptomyces lydicus]|nr:hypothetical protein T261_08892 [Streptomyces lydicus]